jgi:CRISPR-associated protein Csm3
MSKWTHVIEMKFQIELVDGTRIGSAGGGMEIGGVDPNLMALKDPVSHEPYVPGSSLKGKLRSILEKEHGLGTDGKPCSCGKKACPVCPIFGAHMNMKAESGTARLTVRDSHFSPVYAEVWKANPVLEEKTENIIDRSHGAAVHPRTQERVPAGALFDGEMLLKVFERDNSDKMVKDLRHALGILERFDSLGAGGSRGSGRIKINNFTEKKVALADLTL